jgi:hypothetical protein
MAATIDPAASSFITTSDSRCRHPWSQVCLLGGKSTALGDWTSPRVHRRWRTAGRCQRTSDDREYGRPLVLHDDRDPDRPRPRLQGCRSGRGCARRDHQRNDGEPVLAGAGCPWAALQVRTRRGGARGHPHRQTVKYQAIGEAPQPCVYLPLRQNYSQAMVLYVEARPIPRACCQRSNAKCAASTAKFQWKTSRPSIR